MGFVDFKTYVVNKTKEEITLELQHPAAQNLVVRPGEWQSLRTSLVRRMNTMNGPTWRVRVRIKDRPDEMMMTISPIKHLLEMTLIVFFMSPNDDTILAQGVVESFWDRLTDGIINGPWEERSLVDIDLHANVDLPA